MLQRTRDVAGFIPVAEAIAHSARERSRARRIRVAFCLDNLGIGGTELNAVRTAEQIDSRRIDLRLVTLQASGPLRARFEAAGVPVVPFPIDGLLGASAIREGRRLARYLRESKIDIVHCHDIYTNVFVAPLARIAGVPAVICSRRWWQSLPDAKYRIANHLAYRTSTRVLANSPAVARSLRDDGISDSRVVTVSNFVDEKAFAPVSSADRASMRRALEIPHDALVIGCVARLVPIKDHATLLEAIASLVPRHPSLRLALIGDGPCRGDLETQAARLGIRTQVIFAGLVHGDVNMHAMFDISVLPSISEGFPNSVVEAMAAGCPVVATDVGGIPDAVIDGETGYLVPSRSPARLAGAIALLVEDAELRERMGLAGKARARERFHVSSVVPGLEALYRELAGVSA
jgi:glycosyltransferase involved in cell wall biosynthesis